MNSVNLNPQSQRILRVILKKPVVAGGELSILANMNSQELYNAVQPLVDGGVISANAPLSDRTDLKSVYFNLNPSARDYAAFAVR